MEIRRLERVVQPDPVADFAQVVPASIVVGFDDRSYTESANLHSSSHRRLRVDLATDGRDANASSSSSEISSTATAAGAAFPLPFRTT